MATKPEGAVGYAEARTAHGPWYVVSSKTSGFRRYVKGTLEKREMPPGRSWFADKVVTKREHKGYCFLNYFHALAYSLKCKNDHKTGTK